MKAIIQKVAQAFVPKKLRVAESKREMEKRLRAGGLSITQAKIAVAAHFRGKGE
jgi:hypothetical protein